MKVSVRIAAGILAFLLLSTPATVRSDRLDQPRAAQNGPIGWVTQFGTPEWDLVHAITYDASTNSIYAAGATRGGSPGYFDAWIARIDSNGNKVCERVFGTAGDDGATGIAADGNGNIYIGGYTPSGNGYQPDGWVARYDANCTQQWVDIFGLSESGDGIADLDVDGNGNVYLAGWTREANDDECACNNTDVLIAKYSPAGSQLWVKKFGTFEEDRAQGIAVTEDGAFYVTGRWEGGSADDSADAYVARLDKDGNQLWVRSFGSSAREFGEAVAVDAAGNAYAAGWTRGDLFDANSNSSTEDVWVAKYTADGTQEWGRQIGTESQERPQGVAVDGTGSVHVVGFTEGEMGSTSYGGSDIFLARYASDGTPQEVLQFGTTEADEGFGVTFDPAGQTFVAGNTSGDWGTSEPDGNIVVFSLGCTIVGEVYTRPEPNLTHFLWDARVSLRRGGQELSSTTTQQPYGDYTLNGPCAEDLVVRVELIHGDPPDRASAFQIVYQQPNGPPVYVETQPFSAVGHTEPLRKDIVWVDGFNDPPLVTHPAIQPNRQRFDDLAMIYVHIYQPRFRTLKTE